MPKLGRRDFGSAYRNRTGAAASIKDMQQRIRDLERAPVHISLDTPKPAKRAPVTAPTPGPVVGPWYYRAAQVVFSGSPDDPGFPTDDETFLVQSDWLVIAVGAYSDRSGESNVNTFRPINGVSGLALSWSLLGSDGALQVYGGSGIADPTDPLLVDGDVSINGDPGHEFDAGEYAYIVLQLIGGTAFTGSRASMAAWAIKGMLAGLDGPPTPDPGSNFSNEDAINDLVGSYEFGPIAAWYLGVVGLAAVFTPPGEADETLGPVYIGLS